MPSTLAGVLTTVPCQFGTLLQIVHLVEVASWYVCVSWIPPPSGCIAAMCQTGMGLFAIVSTPADVLGISANVRMQFTLQL